uniref:C2H2-type domain-containing protein n=1 Tax=Caenorhabditis tropicalis TaxID=1561998 RepID=A0A1I7UD67_9PELO
MGSPRRGLLLFLNRKNSPNGVSTVAICRLCNHTPFGGKLFFQHLFTLSHTQKLSASTVSRKSFSFWKDHIERCRGITVTVPLARQPSENNEFTEENRESELSDSLVFKTIPLFSSGVSKEKEKLSASEVDLLVNLMLKIDAQNWRGERDCLSMFIKTVSRPKFCDVCQYNTPLRTYKFARHMMSEMHLNALTGVSQKEFNFWVNLLTLESDSSIDPADRMRILYKKNTRPIPLLDFKIESLLIEKPYRDDRLSQLQETLMNMKDQLVHTNPFGPSNSHEEIACFACNLPKNHFKSQSELIFHIFSEQHVKYLRQFGFSEKAVLWWKKFFDDVKNQSFSSISEPSRIATVVPTTVSTVPPPPDVPRVPLLHLPMKDAKMSTQKVFVMSTREMVTTLQPRGKEIAEKRIVDWKCEYCSSSPLTTELKAFEHIVSQKHLEKVKFRAPVEDLVHWKNWTKIMNEGGPVERKEEETESKTEQNVPRAPMLDQVPPNVPYVNQKGKIYSRLGNYIRRFQKCTPEQLEKARAMSVNWKCTYCKDKTLPNMLYAFNHIMSMGHLENMSHVASIEDLDFWKSWAKGILGDSKETTPVPRVAKEVTPEPAPSKVVVLETVPIKVAKAVEPAPRKTVRAQNNPRIPMLDEMKEGDTAVSKERFNEALDECLRVFKSGGKHMHMKNKVLRAQCNICGTPKKLFNTSNYPDAFLHIAKPNHRMNMNYTASASDLQYWMDWVKEWKKEVEKGTKKSAPNNEPKKKEVTPERAPITNDPRIPLLDVLRNQSGLLSKSEYQSKFLACRVVHQLCGESKATRQKVNCTCYHCPGNHRMTTIHEIMDHVFLSDHARMINYQGSAADFAYYEQLQKSMRVRDQLQAQGCAIPVETIVTKQPEVSAKTPPVLVVNPIRAPVTPVCSIPLFKTPSSTRQTLEIKWTCPTNIQYEFLTRLKLYNFATRKTYMEELPRCEACGIDMSGWTLLACALHAFSVSHLHKYQLMGGQVSIEDYEWWNQMVRSSLLSLPSPSKLKPCRMGIYVSPLIDLHVFTEFTSYEKELISNVDVNKLNGYTEQLVSKFGGCLICGVWLLSPVEVVNHYFSAVHLKK